MSNRIRKSLINRECRGAGKKFNKIFKLKKEKVKKIKRSR